MRKLGRISAVVVALVLPGLIMGGSAAPVRADPSVPWGPIPSEIGRVFPDVAIAPAARVRRLPPSAELLPAQVPWKRGESLSVDDFLTTTATRAFVILHRGRLVAEWYGPGTSRSSRLSSWSVAKSLVSLLTQQAIDEERLTLTTRVVDVLPWLRVATPTEGDAAYNRVTVRDLLDMTSGIDAPESYEADPTDPEFLTGVSGLATGTYQLLVTPDLRSYARMHRRLVFEPGTRGEYISFNTQLLSMVVAKALGQDLVTAFRERLWEPAGAEFRATWNLDRPGGTAKGFCCLNASARDFARLGLLVAEAGSRRSPVSEAWLDRLLTPRPRLVSTWPYSTSFWHIPGDQRGRRLADASAIGVFGQYVYVNRHTDTVIVKLSDYGIEQDEAATYRVFRTIARSW